MSPSPASRHAVRAHGREPLLGRPHPLPCPPHLQPPSLSEWNPGRQRSHFQPVTVALQRQAPESSHWRRREPGGGRAQGSRGSGASPGARAVAPPHLRGGSRRPGRAPPGPSGRSPPGSADSAARPCGLGSAGNARRGPCFGRAPGQTRTARSGRCSCTLWAGGGGEGASAALASGGRGGRAPQPPRAHRPGSSRKVTDGGQARLDQGHGDRSLDLPKQDTLQSRGGTIREDPDTQDPPR